MIKLILTLLVGLQILLAGCTAIKTPTTNQYQLTAFSSKQYQSHPTKLTILVTTPEAVGGYQSEQMLYKNKPYELTAFVKNSWADQPAKMLFPLIVQSIQRSGYFHAVASSPHADSTDYRLDTQLIELQQNFLRSPSVTDLVVKVTITRVHDNNVIASRVVSQHVNCPMNTPYGGVIAANRATENLTAELTRFVVSEVRKDSHLG